MQLKGLISHENTWVLLGHQDLLIWLAPACHMLVLPILSFQKRMGLWESGRGVRRKTLAQKEQHWVFVQANTPCLLLSSPSCWMGSSSDRWRAHTQPPTPQQSSHIRQNNLACKGHKGTLCPCSHLISSETNYSLMRRLILNETPCWKHSQNKCDGFKHCSPQKRGDRNYCNEELELTELHLQYLQLHLVTSYVVFDSKSTFHDIGKLDHSFARDKL